jgi:hypothetical protein
MNIAYLPGIFPPALEPLGRFLPPIPDGASSDWLHSRVAPGGWVLDPFGTSPRLAVEIAHLGYRVLVAANNPIVRFLLEMAANPPPRSELQTSLAELASAYRGSERIEPHIRDLYRTECSHCGSPIMAEAFLWEHTDGGKATAPAPYARIYSCPVCRTSGEFPCTAGDISRANAFSSNTLHRARALERVAPHNDPDRPFAEQAINVYLPRAVYALFTLINKLEGLDLPPIRRKHLTALLLHACEQAHTLWKYPAERERRYQLIIPPRFREQNVWLALEQGLDVWSAEGNPGRAAPVPIFSWPITSEQEIPPAGIWLFEGRLKSLAESLSGLDVRAVCTAIPRPSRAFWTLSALWAGWLWGYEAVGPFRSVLRRQRYDWGWHTTALAASMGHLDDILAADTPILGLLGEFEPNYLAAVLVAADLSGLQLDSLAIRPEINSAQFTWHRQHSPQAVSEAIPESIAIQATTHYLEERGEPASFAHSFSAAIAGLVQAHCSRNLARKQTPAEDVASEAYTLAAAIGKEILSYRHGFLRYTLAMKGKAEPIATQLPLGTAAQPERIEPRTQEPGTESKSSAVEKSPAELPESGLVWLRDTSRANLPPLGDRIEVALVNHLLKHNGCSLLEIDSALCTTFPALFTPETEYLQICLDSYAEPDPDLPGRWRLHPQDTPASRRQDLTESDGLIRRLGERLGLSTQLCPSASAPDGSPSQHTFCWVDRHALPQFWLFPTVSAVIGEIILQSTVPIGKSLIILPGGRANLVAYKLRRDPRLGRLCDAAQSGWRFIKFRHLRWLVDNPLLSRENFNELLALDPLTYSTPQLRLL